MIFHQRFTLPDATFVYPGHDDKGQTVTTIGEVRIMENLHLPPPRKRDVAVPANRTCGHTQPQRQRV